MSGIIFLLVAAGAGMGAVGAAGVTSGTMQATTSPLTMVRLHGERPLVAEIRHDVTIDLKTRAVRVRQVAAQVRHAELELFGGQVTAQAAARIDDARTTDLQVTLTLSRIDLRAAMQALALPRAGDLEGLASGELALEMNDRVFTRARVRVEIAEGSGKISRGLLAQMLGFNLNDDVMAQFEKALTDNYGAERMIPLAGFKLTGGMEAGVLRLTLPIRNEALEVTLEPRIEAPLLWNGWSYVQREMERQRGKWGR
jgi:hypothetical protein